MTWTRRTRFDEAAVALANRHYSRRRKSDRLGGPFDVIVLVTADDRALWVSAFPRRSKDGLLAWRCSYFRNEGGGALLRPHPRGGDVD